MVQEMNTVIANLGVPTTNVPPANAGTSAAVPRSFAVEMSAHRQGDPAQDLNSRATTSANGKKFLGEPGKSDKRPASPDVYYEFMQRNSANQPDASTNAPNGQAGAPPTIVPTLRPVTEGIVRPHRRRGVYPKLH